MRSEITQRKQAEASLLRERDRAQAYFDVAGVVMVALNEKGEISLINRKGYQTLGYKDENELIGQNWFDTCLPPQIKEEVKSVFGQLMRGDIRHVEYYENPVITSTGEERVIAWHNALLTDETGRISGSLGSGEDITGRKKAEEALAKSEAEYRTALNNIIVGVVVHASDTRIQMSNPTATTILGLTAEQMSGKEAIDPAWCFLYEDLTQMKVDDYPVSKVIATKTHLHNYITGINRPDRDYVTWVNVNAVPIFADDGELEKVIVNFDDITERKRTEEALVESQRKLSLHLEQTISGVIEWDKAFNARYWNPAAEKIFGYNSDEALGHSAPELIIPENIHSEIDIVWNKLLRQTGGVYNTNENTTKDGKIIICEWFNTPLVDNQGVVTGVMSLVNDVTDRKQAESELARYHEQLEGLVKARTTELEAANRVLEEEIGVRKRTEEKLLSAKEGAERASRAKSEFLSNMSHELRSPLTAMLGFTQMLERDVTIGKEQREEISIVNRSGQHLLSLINDVLNIAKIEAGRITLNEVSFDLHEFLRNISELFHSRAVEKGLFFITENDDLPHYIRGDEGKLRQALINLLSNAMKFTKTGGVIFRVKSDDATTILTPGDSLPLHFEVEDTGCGIEARHLDKIFDPFVQTSDGVEKTTGTGLGLTISRQFINLMGGAIEAESELNSGSLFRFEIAVGKAEASEIENSLCSRRIIALAPGQPSFRILVVEDLLENRKLLVKMLRTVGFEVQEARDGKQGVEVFHSWHPDLIWMDMRMPVMDGFEATKQNQRRVRKPL